MEPIDFLMLDEGDNIVIAVRPISSGERIDLGHCQVTVRSDIPVGYKVAIREIAAGQSVVKKGVPIGVARVRIEPGDLVHVGNLVSTYIAPHLR